MVRWFTLLIVTSALCAGCGNRYLKTGDGAAAVGDWRRATEEYGRALQKDPNNPALRAKYDQAKTAAFADAMTRARRLLDAKDFEAARGDVDYAATLQVNSAEAADLQHAIHRGLALGLVDQARVRAPQDPLAAFDLLDKARAASKDDEVGSSIAAAQSAICGVAAARAQQLREQALAGTEPAMNYDLAISLLERSVAFDPSQASLLTSVQAERAHWVTSEYERLASAGDEALVRHDWQHAAELYHTADQLSPGGRVAEPAHYADLLATAATAVEHRQWVAAAESYRQATEMAQDRDRYAATQFELVDVRPYRIRLQSVVVKPTRPGGEPWVGKTNPALARLAGMVVGTAMGVPAPLAGSIAAEFASVPPENLPTLCVEVALPDGRRFRTPAKRGCYVTYDAEAVVASNHFDDRTLDLRVVHAPSASGELDVGMVTVPIKDLLDSKPIAPTQSLLGLGVIVETADGTVDGMVAGLQPVRNPTNQSMAPSIAAPGSVGYLITRIDAGLRAGDYQNELTLDGLPDPRVLIVQDGRIVYEGVNHSNVWDITEQPQAVYLFVIPGQPLDLRLTDSDPNGLEPGLIWKVTTELLAQGSVDGTSTNGSKIHLVVQPRPVGP